MMNDRQMLSFSTPHSSFIIFLPHWLRKTDRAAVAVAIHGADAEEVVVLRHALDRVARHVADEQRIGPDGCGRLAPDDFIAGEIRFGVGGPLQIGVVGQSFGDEADRLRTSRGAGQRRERDGVDARDLRDVGEIHEVGQVAVDDAVLGGTFWCWCV